VRFMKPGEKLKLLSEHGSSHSQPPRDHGRVGPVGLGGVMGGFDTMVTARRPTCSSRRRSSTRDDPGQGARALARERRGASLRARRRLRGTLNALERATALTLEICGGEPGPSRMPMASCPAARVRVRPRACARSWATTSTRRDAPHPQRLACEVARNGALPVKPPSWRFDLAIEEDFVEEIARIHGYEHVPATPPRSSVPMLRSPKGRRDDFDLRHARGRSATRKSSTTASSPRTGSGFRRQSRPVRLANPDREHHERDAHEPHRRAGADACAPTSTAASRACASSRSGAASRATRGPRRAAGAHRRHRLRLVAPEQWAEKAARSISSTQGRRRDACGGRPSSSSRRPSRVPSGRCAVIAGGTGHRGRGRAPSPLAAEIRASRPGVVFELRPAPSSRGSPRFPGLSACPSCAATSPASFPKHPRRGRAGGRPRRLPPGSAEFEVFDQYRGKGRRGRPKKPCVSYSYAGY
jgi:phenylalanyl-tRNA synthetase beta chain